MTEDASKNDAAEPPKAQWSLRVLGGFRLMDHAENEAADLGKLDRALLVYLVLSRQPRHPRAKLATLFWPNRTEALHSLSVSLNTLRKALGDKDGAILVRKNDPLACCFDGIDVDALVFEDLVSQGTPEALEQAEALYAGDLLDGIDIRSDEFEHWLLSERARLHSSAVDCLCRLMRLREQAGLSQKAFETARRVLQLDELCEDAHRTIVRLHLKAGQRAAARKQAQYCEVVLRREKIEPEAETARLILETRQSGSADPSRPAPPSSLSVEEVDPQPIPVPTPTSTETGPDVALPLSGRFGARRLWLWIGGSFFGLLAFAAIATSATYQKNPELLPAWIANIVMPIQSIDPLPPRPSIAVLPFKAIGNDPAETTLADGISEGITNALSIASDMRVTSSYSARTHGDGLTRVAQLAKDLHVRYLLHGTVQKSGDRVSVQVGLIDAEDMERQVWGKPYDRRLGDFIDLQKDITLEVLTSLEVTLTKGEGERINLAHGTRNLDAWLAAAQGEIALRKLTRQDNQTARSYYEEAHRLDSKYPGALAGLAWTDLVDVRFGWGMRSPTVLLREASELADQAYRLDPDRSRTLALLGTIALLSCRLDQAVSYGEQAVEIEPNDADAAALLAYTLTYAGEPNRAVNLVRKGMKLSPYYPDWYRWLLGRANRLAGHHGESITWLTTANRSGPESLVPLVELTVAHVEMDQIEKARRTARDVLRVNDKFSAKMWVAAICYSDPAIKERELQALIEAGLPE